MQVSRSLAALGLSIALGGCLSQGDGQRATGHYVGFVTVWTEPARAGEPPGVRRTTVRTLGGWLDLAPKDGGVESLGAGWRSSRRLIVPDDCRLVIIVRSAAELASARTLIDTGTNTGGSQCLVQDID
jgi:hypothetical protein